MIIGSDYLPLINLKVVLSITENGLEARESHFGWYLSRPLTEMAVNDYTASISESKDIALHEQVKTFWEIEEIEQPQSTSEDDEKFETFYQHTTYKQQDGRYVTRLPFRKEFPKKNISGVISKYGSCAIPPDGENIK